MRLVGGGGKGVKRHLAIGHLQLGFIFSEGLPPLVIFFPVEKVVVRDWPRFILQRQHVRGTQGSLTPTIPFRSQQALKANPLDLFDIGR